MRKTTALSMLATATVCKFAQLRFEEALCGTKLPLIMRKGAVTIGTISMRQESFAHTCPIQIRPFPDLGSIMCKAAVSTFSAPAGGKKLTHLCLLQLLRMLLTCIST